LKIKLSRCGTEQTRAAGDGLMATFHGEGGHPMSTPYEHDHEVAEAAEKATTSWGWFMLQIVGCVATAMVLAGVATLVSRYLFAGM
jgi:hypothetical protein